MKIKNNITALLAVLGFMTSCSDDITTPTYSVGAGDNAIVLRAGISEGNGGLVTRAGAESNHTTPGHKTFTANTKLTLRVDGTWLGKADGSAPHGSITSTLVSQKTTATIGDAVTVNSEGSATHNKVTFTSAEQLYWDDYGTADPANMPTVEGNGRAKGLTIYGAAVDGVATAPTVDNWTNLNWNVGTPDNGVIDQTGGWSAKDLLTSNNVQVEDIDKPYSTDGTYKFDDRNEGKLLEFTHAMTKVTVNLTAGDGFPGYENGAANAKFETAPTVTLLGFNYTGTVNVEDKTSTSTASTVSNIKTHLSSGGENSHTATLDALVFPGNRFDDATEIVTLTADGNNYSVTATKLNAAIHAAKSVSTSAHYNANDNKLLQAVNYVINITVNKTGIDVTATIKDWETVNSAEEAPIININKCYGHEGTNFAKEFSFYRSTLLDGSYLVDNNSATVSFADSKYTMTPQLFWPDHSTHYFFRGIWPMVGSAAENTPTAKVETNGICVDNCTYVANTYPTDLMIGMPRKDDGTSDEECKAGHAANGKAIPGICATDAVAGSHPNEGLVHMNFQYAMSQVIVKLETSDDASPDKVTFDEHTSVQIVDCYNSGKIKFGDGSSDFTGKTLVNYTMSNDNSISNPETNNYANYRNVIIPQSLTNGTGAEAKELKFRISVGDGTTTDIYETVLGIKNIEVTEGGSNKSITAWEPGKIYIYTLKITKTDIKVVATLKDWIEVKANESVWF